MMHSNGDETKHGHNLMLRTDSASLVCGISYVAWPASHQDCAGSTRLACANCPSLCCSDIGLVDAMPLIGTNLSL